MPGSGAACSPQGVLAPNVLLQRHSVRLFDGIVDGAESVVIDKDQAVVWMLDRWVIFEKAYKEDALGKHLLDMRSCYTVVEF